MPERLRICLIASARFPVCEPFMGGLEAHTHALASALSRRGHDVSVFAAPGSDPDLDVTELPVAGFVPSATARADVGHPPEVWMREHHAYLDLMMGLAAHRYGTFDVVHNNSLHHLPVAMSGLLDVPVLTTLHTPPLAWLESAAALAAPGARFVAVSRHLAEAWRATVRAETIHNGVDIRCWRAGPGGHGAVWTGRLVPEKAPHEALDAARLAGVPIVLAGPRVDPRYFEQMVRPRLSSTARYAGHLRGADLRRLVGRADVALVTPHWQEPFGLVVVEAMASGTPVAAYDSGAVGELLDDHSGRLVARGDIPALAQALREASCLDRELVRDRAVTHFDHERMVDAYEDVYARSRDRAAA